MSAMASKLIKQTPSGKYLYSIAYEFRESPGVWKPAILYVHATDAGDARVQYLQSEAEGNHRHMRIVGIAPVIGYHVNDNHGEDLTV